MKGEWRDVPEGQRWWDEVLAGGIEEKRVMRLEVIKSLVPVMRERALMIGEYTLPIIYL